MSVVARSVLRPPEWLRSVCAILVPDTWVHHPRLGRRQAGKRLGKRWMSCFCAKHEVARKSVTDTGERLMFSLASHLRFSFSAWGRPGAAPRSLQRLSIPPVRAVKDLHAPEKTREVSHARVHFAVARLVVPGRRRVGFRPVRHPAGTSRQLERLDDGRFDQARVVGAAHQRLLADADADDHHRPPRPELAHLLELGSKLRPPARRPTQKNSRSHALLRPPA